MSSAADRIEEFERLIGYHFTDRKLAQKALTHTSYANEKLEDKAFNNERLEFLGDAVLELVTSQMLYATAEVGGMNLPQILFPGGVDVGQHHMVGEG